MLVGDHLDHSPMGGISQRQSESMTGSISRHRLVGSINNVLAFHSAFAGSISQRRCGREASAHAGKNVFVFVFVFVLCFCFVFVFVFVLVMQVCF